MTKKELTKNEITNALNINSTMTAAELIKTCTASKSTVNRALKDLLADNTITKEDRLYSLIVIETPEEVETIKVGSENLTFTDSANTVDCSQFGDHLDAINEINDHFTVSKNFDGRKGIWLTSKNYKFRILLAQSGSCRIFLDRLSDQQIHTFNVSDDIDVNTVARRVLAPAKPTKMTPVELVDLVNTMTEKTFKKYSRKVK